MSHKVCVTHAEANGGAARRAPGDTEGLAALLDGTACLRCMSLRLAAMGMGYARMLARLEAGHPEDCSRDGEADMNQNEIYATGSGWQECQGSCHLTLPSSSAFFPGLRDRCRLCRAADAGDPVLGQPFTEAEPEPAPRVSGISLMARPDVPAPGTAEYLWWSQGAYDNQAATDEGLSRSLRDARDCLESLARKLVSS